MVTRRVVKYELDITDKQTIDMPDGAEVLSIQEHRGKLVMWALACDFEDIYPRTFYVVGTEEPLPDYSDDYWCSVVYCATVQGKGGRLVWHVFTEIDIWWRHDDISQG